MGTTFDDLQRAGGVLLAALLPVAGCGSDNASPGTSPSPESPGSGGSLVGTGGRQAGAPDSGGTAVAGSGGTALQGAGGSPPGGGGAGAAAGGSVAAGGSGESGTGGAGGMLGEGSGGGLVDGGGSEEGGCSRESLAGITDQYFVALSAQDPSALPLSPAVKFTENGEELEVGEGLWANAGETKFKLRLLDTELCMSVTESVVADGGTDIPLGLRLKVENQRITEIEHIAVRSGDYVVASNTRVMMGIDVDEWEAIEPDDNRWTRDELEAWLNKYFKSFPSGGCDFDPDCRRLENGFALDCTVGASCSPGEPPDMGAMDPRLIVVDVEANLAAGFVMFAGAYTDFHMIKVKDRQVIGVYTILGEADGSGWD